MALRLPGVTPANHYVQAGAVKGVVQYGLALVGCPVRWCQTLDSKTLGETSPDHPMVRRKSIAMDLGSWLLNTPVQMPGYHTDATPSFLQYILIVYSMGITVAICVIFDVLVYL